MGEYCRGFTGNSRTLDPKLWSLNLKPQTLEGGTRTIADMTTFFSGWLSSICKALGLQSP